LLNAGWLYECARESETLRCWLILRNRPREMRGKTVPGLEFKTSSANYIFLVESGWENWLVRNFADELVANASFVSVIGANPDKVRESLKPFNPVMPKAVELPGRYLNRPGSQNIEIQIHWADHTNAEIGEQMKQLAAKVRPTEWPEPQRRGKAKATSIISW